MKQKSSWSKNKFGCLTLFYVIIILTLGLVLGLAIVVQNSTSVHQYNALQYMFMIFATK